MRRFSRDLTMHAVAVACLLVAPHSIFAAPPPVPHRAVLTRVAPVYPELARRMGVSGVVTVVVQVLPNGTVSETHVEKGHALLRLAAEEAVHHWRFAADPNPSECTVAVDFEIPH